MTEPATGETGELGAERHASWLELFFDLVAVAGIGMLAHLLEEDSTAGGIAIYVTAFVAFWFVWACYTTYGNIAGDDAHLAPMLLGMAVLGVMTAAVPEIHAEHAQGFAVAYVVGRLAAARPWRESSVVVDLPVVQAFFGVIPWIVSFWFEGDVKSTLWGVGLALDVFVLVTTTREKLLASGQSRLDRTVQTFRRRVEQHGAEVEEHDDGSLGIVGYQEHRGPQGGAANGRGRERSLRTTVTAFDADRAHLGERLGLFVLIVLGEGLVQVIDGASEAVWDRSLLVAGAGAFALIVGLWSLGLRRGYAGIALLHDDSLPPRIAWAAHLVATGALATLAAVLGGVVAEPAEPVGDHDRAILTIAFGAYGLLCVAVHLGLAWVAQRSQDGGSQDGRSRSVDLRRAADIGVPFVVAATVAGFAGDGMAGEKVVWVLAAGVLVSLGLSGVSRRRELGIERRPRRERRRDRRTRRGSRGEHPAPG